MVNKKQLLFLFIIPHSYFCTVFILSILFESALEQAHRSVIIIKPCLYPFQDAWTDAFACLWLTVVC
jgi:hypothetical protein